MATATFRIVWDSDTSRVGRLYIDWSENVSGFSASDIRANVDLSLGIIIPNSARSYEYIFQLRNFTDRPSLFFTIPADSVRQGNPAYEFPVQSVAPDAPTGLSATVSGKQVALSWTAPANDGGSDITRYEYRYAEGATAGGTWRTTGGTGTTFTVTGLKGNTQYTFEVRAVNASGNSAASNAVTTTTEAVVPNRPRNLTLTPAATSVALAWDAPTDTGGAAITKYEVRYRKGTAAWGAWTNAGTDRSETITGLDKGSEYRFQVRAVNSVGNSRSLTGTTTTLTTVPTAPRRFAATPAATSLTLTWRAPADIGGAAITKYEVRRREGTKAWGAWTNTGTDLSETITALKKGTAYTFEVRAVNAVGNSPSVSVSTTTRTTAPSLPLSLSATPAQTSVALSWTAPTDAGGTPITRYEVRYRAGTAAGGTWRSTGGTGTTFTVTGLRKGTQYTFEVRAVNATGAGAAGRAITTRTLTTVPSAPRTLTATATQTTLSLSWTAPSDIGGTPIIRYEYRIGTGAWTTTGGIGTTFQLTGLSGNTAYSVSVRAVNAVGNSPVVSGSFRTAPLVPDAPRTLTATPAATSVALAWTAPAEDGGSAITRYEYRYRAGAGTWEAWTTTGGTDTDFTVTGLTRNTEYTFEVRAVNARGNSPGASVTETTTQTDVGAPTGVSVRVTATAAVLTWTAPTETEGAQISDYEVRYRKGTAAWGDWASAGTDTTETLTGLDKGTAYTFQVRARIVAGAGIVSAFVTATTLTTAPTAPRTLTATPAATSVALSWTAPADIGGTPITRYEIRYKTGSGNFGNWVTTGGTQTTFTVVALRKGQPYTFEVRAVNATGNSPESNAVAATTRTTAPSLPLSLSATPAQTSVALSWDAPTDDGGTEVTTYEVRYRAGTAAGGTWRTTGGTGTTFTVTGLRKGTQYTFEVRALNATGAGAAGRAITTRTLTTAPSAPRVLTSTPAQTSVALSWTAPSDIGGTEVTTYEVRYRVQNGVWGNWTTTASAGTTFTVSALRGNTTYEFQVRAVNANGNSNVATLTTRTTATVPTAPRGLTLTPAATRISVVWQAPVDDGGAAVSRYEVRYRRGSGAWSAWTSTGTSTSASITGLQRGAAHTVEVRAVNSVGNSPAASQTATTLTTVPTVPRTFRASVTGTSVALSWTAPADNGGSAILRYEYRYRETVGGTWTNWATVGRSLSRTVSRLKTTTRYTFEVRAVNARGDSPAASTSALTSQTVPSAPTAFSVTVLSGTTALLSWKSPGDITGFQVNWAAGSSVGSNWRSGRGTQTFYLVTGLNRQTQYAFSVRGVNRAGAGARSQIKTARTPIASPHNALFFKECVNYIGGGVRVKKHGNPSQIIRSVADNDYGTFSEEKDYTVDISRNGAATRVDAFFVKCKGVSRHSGTPSGGSGSGWTNVTVPATVRNYEGRSVSTTVAGFQHHLLLLNSHFTAKSVRLQFQGSGVQIYEMMLLEFGLEIDANGDFTEIAPDFVDRSGEIRSGPGGRLSYGAPIGAGRDTWEIAYGVEVVPGKTLLQTPQAFLYWRSENRNHVHAMEPSRFPWRLFPATFVGDRVPVRYRTDDKTAGELLSFSVAER